MGTHLNCLAELAKAVLTSTHNLCFEKKYEKYLNFLSENFPFLVVKVSIYLNRCELWVLLKALIKVLLISLSTDKQCTLFGANKYKHNVHSLKSHH